MNDNDPEDDIPTKQRITVVFIIGLLLAILFWAIAAPAVLLVFTLLTNESAQHE